MIPTLQTTGARLARSLYNYGHSGPPISNQSIFITMGLLIGISVGCFLVVLNFLNNGGQ